MPASSPGNMGGSVREPALSVTLWLSWGAVLGAVTCAVALLIQQAELQSLRREVSRLQRSGGASQKRGEPPWQSLWEQSPDVLGAWKDGAKSRRRRAVLTQKHKIKAVEKNPTVLRLPCRTRWARQSGGPYGERGYPRGSQNSSASGGATSEKFPNQENPIWVPERLTRKLPSALPEDETTNPTIATGNDNTEKQSVLHLVPINITSKADSDMTEVMWQPALRRGRGLEAQGDTVRVRDTGIYLLYSQVLFHDVTFTMGQVVSREGQGRRETLFRCIKSMPSDPDRAYNSCYSAGVFHLHQGDIITVKIPRANAKLSLSPHGTFLGGFVHCAKPYPLDCIQNSTTI